MVLVSFAYEVAVEVVATVIAQLILQKLNNIL